MHHQAAAGAEVASARLLPHQASVIETDLAKMSPDMAAIEDYRAKAADYAQRAAELDAVTAQRDEVRGPLACRHPVVP